MCGANSLPYADMQLICESFTPSSRRHFMVTEIRRVAVGTVAWGGVALTRGLTGEDKGMDMFYLSERRVAQLCPFVRNYVTETHI